MTMTTADQSLDGGYEPRGERPKRRRFSAEFKARILQEYEAADRGERGEILRRRACIPPTSSSAPRPHGPTVAWINQPSQEALNRRNLSQPA